MEPIYEFDNKDIKELRNNISHDCRLIEAQSIDFLLYLESKVGEEIDPARREKLSNLVSSFEAKLDNNTKLKSELLDSYKEIDRTYTDLKKLGFDHLINSYNTNKLVNVDKKEIVNEEYVQEEQKEPEVVEEQVEEEMENEPEVVEEKDEEVVEEEVNNDIDAIVAAAEAEEATEEQQEVDDNTEESEQVEEAEEEQVEETTNEPLIPTEEPEQEQTEEPVMVESAEAPQEEAVLIPTAEQTEEQVEEPIMVESTETAPTEDNAEAVMTPTEEVAEPELIIPAIEGNTEVQEEVNEEPVEAPQEEAAVEEVVTPDLEIPVVAEETASEEAQVTTGEELPKFVKSDDNPTSRILVTDAQYNALKASLSEKEALLSARERTANTPVATDTVTENELVANGLLQPEENVQAKIEQMMEQANQLYQSGDTAGAQALYDQISIENQKLQEQQAVR